MSLSRFIFDWFNIPCDFVSDSLFVPSPVITSKGTMVFSLSVRPLVRAHILIIQDAQLSQTDRAAGCVIVFAKSIDWNWETIFYRHYRSVFNYCDIIGLKICRIRWKKTQNKGYYSVQGHSRSSWSVPIESPYATSYYWLIVTNILPRTVSELSQLIVQISDTLRFRATPWGLRDNVRCSSWAYWKARSRLFINVNWTFFARCYGWVATSEKRSKIGYFTPTRFQVEGLPPPIIFARLVRPMNALQLCRWQFSRNIMNEWMNKLEHSLRA